MKKTKISFGLSNIIIDLIIKFIAFETRLQVHRSQKVLANNFRLFFHSWINQGFPKNSVRSSKRFWYNVEGFHPRTEFVQCLKWLKGVLSLFSGLLINKMAFCVGARDKKWVADFYRNQAARVEFGGGPDWLITRDNALRARLRKFLVIGDISPEEADLVTTVLPEDLLEGIYFQIRFFLRIVPKSTKKEICSEDLVENSSSACLVLVALERGWIFLYKEHAVPMFLFKNHFSWAYAAVASRVALAEDYGRHICDEDLKKKGFYFKRNRTCRFTHDPTGRVLVCLPFISRIDWLSGEAWTQDMGFREPDLKKIRLLIDSWPVNEPIWVKHHPLKSKGISPESFPPETYDGSGVKAVVFLGWTQGLFECLGAGVPARILLLRPMSSLNETGQNYFRWLQRNGFLAWHSSLAHEHKDYPEPPRFSSSRGPG
jgi:hypothetical protein